MSISRQNLSAVIVTFKSDQVIHDCIQSISDQIKIIVVDNSDDLELKSILNEEYPKVIYHSIDNNGYGAAINFGSNFIKTKYFLILNPDIEDINEKKIIYFEKSSIKIK